MSAAVVFCTTYALILPAITMEKEPVCGMEEHEHSAACYAPGYPFQCPQVHSADVVIHSHEGFCFDAAGTLICPLPEVHPHVHEDSCYQITILEPCALPETEGHTHSDACWEHGEDWLCGLTEAPAHTHTEECFGLGETNLCGLEEFPAHQHTQECYAQEASLVCGQEEIEAHTHGETCFTEELVLGCGQEQCDAHTHTDSCYQSESQLVCTQDHTHEDACYQTRQSLICTLAETAGHTHSDACYVPQIKQTCPLTETEGHRHEPECFRKELICQTEETQGHVHTEACRETILICTLPEGQGHSHTDACMKRLTCTLEETPPHVHTEACLGGEIRELTCTLAELRPHTHSEDCSDPCQIPLVEVHTHSQQCLMTEAQASASLICTMEAHTHDDTCYEAQTLPAEEGYFCGFGSHTHNDQCHDENGELVCSIPEHIHNIACILETYDPAADVELQADWEATFQYIPKTGNWPEDVLAIARTQLGYTESERNCFLYEDGTIRGYTRYGAWYGSPYSDWDAMFVSFCLHYAGVEGFPLDSEASRWAEKLQPIGAYHCGDGYAPKPGDLVFFHREDAAHVGLVSEVLADGGLVTIEGDSSNRVQYCSYAAGDPRVAAYGELPAGKPQPQIIQQSCSGPDYTVTVSYDASANLPEDAALTVREIPRDSDEYAMYYLQAVEAVQSPDGSELPVEIRFARFFDISFISNGQIVEPEGPVEVSITYHQQIDIAEDADSKAVHFSGDGVEVLDAETNLNENQADTFQFTQNTFSVTGTVVTSRSIDLSGADLLTNYATSKQLCNSDHAETSLFINQEGFQLTLDIEIQAYQFYSDTKKLYLTLPSSLSLSGFSCTNQKATVQLDEETNTVLVDVPREPNGNGWYNNVNFTLTLDGTAVNTSDSPVTATVAGIGYTVYRNKQIFTCTASDGTLVTLELLGASMSPDTHTLFLETVAADSYRGSAESYVMSNYQQRTFLDMAAFQIYMASSSQPTNKLKIPAPYRLLLTFPQTPVQVDPIGMAVAVDLTGNSIVKPDGFRVTRQGAAVTSAELANTSGQLDTFGILSVSSLTSDKLTYNYQTDAFLHDPAFSQYYNANSPIGTAGSFHIVAFDTANLNTHTNGNVLAKNVYAGSNFGTNNYANELSYIQNYLKINSGSASHSDHVLVIGSGNEVTLQDNGNAIAVNGTKLDRPKKVIQDADTASDPFIDLNRVKAEVRQIGSILAGYENMYLDIYYNAQDNRIVLNDPNAVGILNVTPSSPELGKNTIYLDGFQSGHNGSIVINVNCAGASTVTLPNALVVVDGTEQGTNEVVEFSNGKVLWNFINANGVTINANRMTGMIIAPGATVNINQNLNGTVVADIVNVKAESHRTDFTGKIVPKTPDGEDDDSNGRSITIQKIKAGYVGTTLAGAQFELQIWNEQEAGWKKVDIDAIVTNAQGLFLLQELQEDIAYKLVETKAPTGYVLADEPFCFWIRPKANASAPSKRPHDFTGTGVDSGGVLNIANEPDEQVETTELTIRKAWESTNIDPPNRISVDIYQIALDDDGNEVSRSLFKTVNLSQILNWEITVTDLPLTGTDSQGNPLTYSYAVEEKPVPGFTASYSENNTRGVSGDTVLITNRETGNGYALPETGGTGTPIYAYSGLLILLSALLYEFFRICKQRREEQN